jgi:hypothetical protein
MTVVIVVGLLVLTGLGAAVGMLQAHAHTKAWGAILGEDRTLRGRPSGTRPRTDPPPLPTPRPGCLTCTDISLALVRHVSRAHGGREI